MRILFCTTLFETVENGPAKFAQLLYNHFRLDENVEFDVLTPDVKIESLGVYKLTKEVPRLFKSVSFVYYAFLFANDVKRINQLNNYDVIWFNNVITGWKSAKTSQDLKHVGMINDDNSMRYDEISMKLSQKYFRHFVFNIIEKRSINVFDKVVVNSMYMQRLVNEYYKPNNNIAVLYKAVNSNLESNSTRLDKSGLIKVLFVKSDFLRGGLLELIEALNNLPYRFLLTIIGVEKNQIELVFDKKDDLKLNFLGKVEQSVVFKELCQNNIFCCPSKKEALGVANMEAMIHSTPVVTSDVGGIPEVMNHGKNGFIAHGPTVDSIAMAMKSCIEDDTEREIKVSNAKEFVVSNFSHKRMISRIMNICDEIVS